MITDIYTRARIKQHHLFTALTTAELAQLLGSANRLRLSSQQHVFHRADPASRFYLVLEGNIQLYITSAQGQLKVLEVVRPGHSFAEALIFSQQAAYPVSAQALHASELISFESDIYLSIVRNNPEACMAMMTAMSKQLNKDVQEIENLSLQSAENRLLLFLLRHSKPSGCNSGELTLDVPKRTLASRLSIQPETFSRLIRKMNTEGIIEESRGLINIPDLARVCSSIQTGVPAECNLCPLGAASKIRSHNAGMDNAIPVKTA